ncbi:F0F1 ATP synthase subunit epsilon [Myxosarcina sp. GI1(2024)]
MKLKILIPTEVFLETTVEQVNAEAKNGDFGILPNHIDFVAALAPGVLSAYASDREEEIYIAIDEGILVKYGDEVLVSTKQAIRGVDLETLHRTVVEEFTHLDEQQKTIRTALAKLETGMMRGILEMGE